MTLKINSPTINPYSGRNDGEYVMNGKSCFFMGHREADERLLPRLELVIDRLIRDENVRYFYVGGYGGFDRIAATAVK